MGRDAAGSSTTPGPVGTARATVETPRREPPSSRSHTGPGRSFVVIMVALVVLGGTLGLGFARWTVTDAGLRARVLAAIERASGLRVREAGRLAIRLLPVPRVDIRAIAVGGVNGAVALEADAISGRLGLSSLWGGEADLQTVALDSPTVVVDLDRLQPILDALHQQGLSSPLLRLFHTAGLQVRSGVIRLLSTDRRRDSLLTEVMATLVWPADDAEATLSGTATWRGVTGDLVVDVDRPGDLKAGGEALASLHLKAPALSLDAEGTLYGRGERQAAGKIAASTPDLGGFLRSIGTPAPEFSGITQAKVTGNATVAGATLSLDDAALHLDDMVFEGALAVRRLHHRESLAGTLATDHIDLDRFLSALPAFRQDSGAWSENPLQTRAIAFDDIDLRVSTSTASLGSFRTEDGSLLLQSGDGRLEASIAEARAYGGLLKGRVVATLDGEITGLRAEATLSRLDLASFLVDVPGHFGAAGSMTGHLSIEGKGTSPASLVRSLKGRGQASIRDGEIGSALLATLVRAAPSASLAALPLAADSMPFDAAAVTATLDTGRVTLVESWLSWPAARAALTGTASLPEQTLDVTATVIDPDGGSALYALQGPWRDLSLKPTRPPS